MGDFSPYFIPPYRKFALPEPDACPECGEPLEDGQCEVHYSCRECGEPAWGGEGYDGYCGNCADRAEQRGEWGP